MGKYPLKSAWHVGLIPALISGVFVYVVTRWYERDGFIDGLETSSEWCRNSLEQGKSPFRTQ